MYNYFCFLINFTKIYFINLIITVYLLELFTIYNTIKKDNDDNSCCYSTTFLFVQFQKKNDKPCLHFQICLFHMFF